MRVCVYYDSDEVTREDIRVALESANLPADAHVVHLAADDARSSPDVGLQSIDSSRSEAFRTQLASFLDQLAAMVRGDPRWQQALSWRGIDLLDVARFSWFFRAAGPAHRAWVAGNLLAAFSPELVVWVATGKDAAPPPLARALHDVFATAGVGFRYVDARSAPTAVPRPGAAVTTARALLRPLVGPAPALWRAMNAQGRRHALDRRGPCRVLFAEDFPHLASVLVPVALRLRIWPGVTTAFVATSDEVARVVREAGCDVHLLDDLVSRRVRLQAARKETQVRRAGEALFDRLRPQRGGPFGAGAPLLQAEFAAATVGAWAVAARQAVFWAEVAAAWRPDLVVTSSYTGSSPQRAAVLAGATVSGARRVWVQHGLATGEPWKASFVHDDYLVWGERARRELVAAGAPAGQVVATGSVKFQELAAGSGAGQGGGGEEGFRLLYLPARSGGRFVSLSNSATMLQMVVDAAASQGCRLTVKVHPEDQSGLFDNLGPDVEVVRHGRAVDAILAADAVVVSTSTAGLEACALDRPVIVLAVAGVGLASEYEEYGSAVTVRSGEDLERAVSEIRRGGSVATRLASGRRRMVDDMFAGLPTDAVERIARHLAVAGGCSVASAEARVYAYYDLPSVTAKARSAAEAAGGGVAVVHTAPEDVAWEDGPATSVVSLESRRTPAFRRHLMAVVDEIFEQARQSASPPLVFSGMEAMEASRYDTYARLAEPVHRAGVIAKLVSEGANVILWVSDQAPEDHQAIERRLAPRGVKFLAVPVGDGRPSSRPGGPRRPPLTDLARRSARSALATARLLARRPTVRPGPPAPGTGPGDEDRPAIVVVEHFERGARVATTVADELRVRNRRPVFLATSPAARAEAGDAERAIAPEEVASRRARLAARSRVGRGSAVARATASALAERQLPSLGGQSMLVCEQLKDLGPLWGHGLAALVLWADVVRRIGPSVMASTTNAPTPVRAAMAAGRAAGATTCLVQHGVLALHNYRTYLTHDWYLVWGERDKRELVAGGAPPERVVVTGSPVFGALAERRRPDAERSGGGALRVVYLASRTGGRLVSLAQGRSMLDMVRQAVARLPGWELAVKPHPGDRSGLFDSLDGVRLVRGGDAVDAILGADAAIVSTSTAGLEACALDRPVVVLDLPGSEPLPHYDEYGAAIKVRSADELSGALAAISGGGEPAERLTAGRRRLVDDMFDGLAPGAAGRVADHLLAIAGRPGPAAAGPSGTQPGSRGSGQLGQ